MAVDHAVLLDTDVFSALFVTPPETALKQGHPRDEWLEAVRGRRVLVAFQTRAEAVVGARSAGWGESRMRHLKERLDATPMVPLDEDVFEAYVAVSVRALNDGDGIHQKVHTADRWVAACAIAKSVPLLSGDAIFKGVPSLALLEVPGRS